MNLQNLPRGISFYVRDLSRPMLSRTWFGPYTKDPGGELVMGVEQTIVRPYEPAVSELVFSVMRYNIGRSTYFFHVRQGLRADVLASAKKEAAQAAMLAELISRSRAGRAFGHRGPTRQRKLHPLMWGLCDQKVPSRYLFGELPQEPA